MRRFDMILACAVDMGLYPEDQIGGVLGAYAQEAQNRDDLSFEDWADASSGLSPGQIDDLIITYEETEFTCGACQAIVVGAQFAEPGNVNCPACNAGMFKHPRVRIPTAQDAEATLLHLSSPSMPAPSSDEDWMGETIYGEEFPQVPLPPTSSLHSDAAVDARDSSADPLRDILAGSNASDPAGAASLESLSTDPNLPPGPPKTKRVTGRSTSVSGIDLHLPRKPATEEEALRMESATLLTPGADADNADGQSSAAGVREIVPGRPSAAAPSSGEGMTRLRPHEDSGIDLAAPPGSQAAADSLPAQGEATATRPQSGERPAKAGPSSAYDLPWARGNTRGPSASRVEPPTDATATDGPPLEYPGEDAQGGVPGEQQGSGVTAKPPSGTAPEKPAPTTAQPPHSTRVPLIIVGVFILAGVIAGINLFSGGGGVDPFAGLGPDGQPFDGDTGAFLEALADRLSQARVQGDGEMAWMLYQHIEALAEQPETLDDYPSASPTFPLQRLRAKALVIFLLDDQRAVQVERELVAEWPTISATQQNHLREWMLSLVREQPQAAYRATALCQAVGFDLERIAGPPTGPRIDIDWPDGGLMTAEPELTIRGRLLPVQVDWVKVFGQRVPVDPDGYFSYVVRLRRDGPFTIPVEMRDLAGRITSRSLRGVRDSDPPTITLTEPINITDVDEESLVIAGTVDDATAVLTLNGEPVTVRPDGHFRIEVPLAIGDNHFRLVVRDGLEREVSATVSVRRHEPLRPAIETPPTIRGFEYVGIEIAECGELRNALHVYRHVGVVGIPRTNLTFVLLPPGWYTQGSPSGESGGLESERPQRGVVIERALLLCQTEVTQRAFQVYGRTNPSPAASRGPEMPVHMLNWHAARDWCERMEMRLPTESEWEYACRAGSETPYFWGEESREASEYAYADPDASGPSEVRGRRRPNAFGLYDMAGNVAEWCEDTFQRSYVGAPTLANAWVVAGRNQRVVRGGAFDSETIRLRSAAREGITSTFFLRTIGFRPAVTVELDD